MRTLNLLHPSHWGAAACMRRQPVCLPSGSRVPCRPCAAAKQAAPRNPRARKKPAGEQRDGSQNGGAENGAAEASSAAAGAEDAVGVDEEAEMGERLCGCLNPAHMHAEAAQIAPELKVSYALLRQKRIPSLVQCQGFE